jgi:NADP-dependent 3-hydroxy acid dehydrogenase YdfG
MEIADRVIIITDASSGIGLATAKHLSTLGAQLVLASRDTEALSDLEGELAGAVAAPWPSRSSTSTCPDTPNCWN